jgi:NADH:ubiquinone oxidoreductase subunit C
MNLQPVLEALGERFQAQAYAVPMDDTFVTLQPDQVHSAVSMLGSEFGLWHLSTITGQDTGHEIQLLYHFWEGHGLTLCTSLSRERAIIPTITDLIPGAAFYEREVSEMLHVTFAGYEGPSALLLADDWNGEAPLRKEFSLDRVPPEDPKCPT